MSETEVGARLSALSSDVLLHTWDLARALDVDPNLDVELCQRAYDNAVAAEDRLAASGMFGAAISVPGDAPLEQRMLARYGREV